MATRDVDEAAINETFPRFFERQALGIACQPPLNPSRTNTITPDIRERLDRIENAITPADERTSLLAQCSTDLAQLSTALRDAAFDLPSRDQRTYNDRLKELSERLESVRSSTMPRQKFSFRSGAKLSARRPPSVPSNDSDSGFPRETTNQPESLSVTALNTILEQHVGYIIPPPSRSAFSNLQYCVLDLRSSTAPSVPLAGLTLTNITSSLLLCGQVNGAIHMTNISDSVLVLSSRQFRMHDSNNCDVYLRTTSRPIIEDCEGIRFAPLPEAMMGGELDEDEMWRRVDDFKWLRSEASPNWCVLPESQRVGPYGWAGIGREMELGARLRAGGVRDGP